MTQLAGVLLTYLVSSVAVFAALAGLARPTKEEAPGLFFMVIGLGPLSISWLLSNLLFYFPGLPAVFYLLAVEAVLFLPILIWFDRLKLLLGSFFGHEGIPFRYGSRAAPLIIFLFGFFLWATMAFQAVATPLTANDPLQYATVARWVYEDKSVISYPYIEPDQGAGRFAGFSHPLGYISLMVWSYLLQGHAESAGLIKLISPIYVLYTLLLLWRLLSGRGRLHGLIAALALLCTPFYYDMSSICHIDPLRIYTFFLSFVVLAELLKKPALWKVVLSGLAIGASMYSHSIGVLTGPFFALIYLVESKEKPSRRIINLLLIAVIALTVGGSQYVYNYFFFGTPVSNDLSVWNLRHLDYQSYFRHDRQIAHLADRILYGALKVLTKFDSFGLGYWVFLLALLWSLWTGVLKHDRFFRVFLWATALYFAATFFSLLLDMDIFILNDRYPLTVQPLVAYGIGLFLGTIFDKPSRPIKFLALVLLLSLVLPSTVLAVYRTTATINRFDLTLSTLAHDDWTKLRQSTMGEYQIIRYARESTPKDSLFLVLRMAEFAYYADRNYIRHVDPRMVEFYKAEDKDKAFEILSSMEIDYVLVPYYLDPSYYNSQLVHILADPQCADLVMDNNYSLYRLRKKKRKVSYQDFRMPEPAARLKQNGQVALAGWTIYKKGSGVTSEGLRPVSSTSGATDFIVNNDGGELYLYSGQGLMAYTPSPFFRNLYNISPGANYHFSARVKGRGALKVYLAEYSGGAALQWILLWEGVLQGEGRFIERQFITSSQTRKYRLIFLLVGQGHFSVRDIQAGRILFEAPMERPSESDWWTWNISDFEEAEPGRPETIGWSTYSDNRSVTWSWGLTKDSFQGRQALFLKQPDFRNYWLYTGPGLLPWPPSSFFNQDWQVSSPEPAKFRIQGRIKGRGRGELYLFWYDQSGYSAKNLEVFDLPAQYKPFEINFQLPEGAREFRAAFLLRGKIWWKGLVYRLAYLLGVEDPEEKLSALYLDQVVITKEELRTVDEAEELGRSVRKETLEESRRREDLVQVISKWRLLISSDLEEAEPARLETLGWSTWSGDRPTTWPWGLTTDSHGGRYALYLERPDSKDYWLYTGNGPLPAAPSSAGDLRWGIKCSESPDLLVKAFVKGQGSADLYLLWYDQDRHKHEEFLGAITLTPHYGPVTRVVRLPVEAREFRVAFLLRGLDKERSAIQVDDLTVDIRGKRGDFFRPEWPVLTGSDLESAEPARLETLGWSTWSDHRAANWPWGLTKDSHGGRYAIYLQQPDFKDYWLYTGRPIPSLSRDQLFDRDWLVKGTGSALFRLKAFVKGGGFTDVYLFWRDKNGFHAKAVDRFYLFSEYKPIDRVVKLPEEAKDAQEFGAAFLLRGKTKRRMIYEKASDLLGRDYNKQELSTLFVDDLRIMATAASGWVPPAGGAGD